MADDGRTKRSKAPVGPAGTPLLKITPAVLYYAPPYNRVIMNSITLQNLTGNFVAYKVKTTAPKRYCVRPNTGVIAPQAIIEVQVHLTAFNLEAESQKEKDRFQIQSVDLSSAELPAESKDVWRTVSDAQIVKQRLKVKFATPPTTKTLPPPSSTSIPPLSTASTPPSSSEAAPPIRHVQSRPDSDSSTSFVLPPSTTLSSSGAPSTTTEVKQQQQQPPPTRSTQDSSKSSSTEELQEKLRKVTVEKDKLAKDLEALLAQNRRLLAAQEQSMRGSLIDVKFFILALVFLLLGYYFGSGGSGSPAASTPTPSPLVTPAIQ